MGATEFEFHHRFWFISSIFAIGFGCSRLDHTNVSVALAQLLVGSRMDRINLAVRLLFGLGALIVAACAGIRSWAAAYLASAVVHDTELHSDRLVADGPYRHLRNPLYFGAILLAIGLGFMASRLGVVVLVAGIWLFTLRLILREEAQLLQTQGESYRRYCDAVPRLIPSWRPRIPAGEGRPNWWDGLAGEVFMWGFTAGIAAFAATLQIRWFGICAGAGALVSFWQHRRR